MDIEFRRYSPDDLEAVVGVFRSNIPKYFTASEEPGLLEFLGEHMRDYFVMTVAGDIVGSGGFALNGGEPPTVSLCWGMVRNDLLNRGLGTALTTFRIKRSREKYGRLPLTIKTSQHTQRFYERFGFVLLRHELDGFGPGIDVCEMRLED